MVVIFSGLKQPSRGITNALEDMKQLRSHLGKTVYGAAITIRFFPGLEEMGIRILPVSANRSFGGGESIYLADIDDAHYYRVEPRRICQIRPDMVDYALVFSKSTGLACIVAALRLVRLRYAASRCN